MMKTILRAGFFAALVTTSWVQALAAAPGSITIVGKQKSHARHFDEVVVNGFELVRKRINARDGKREIRIVFVSERQPHRLDAQAKAQRIAIVGLLIGGDFKGGKLFGSEDRHVGHATFQSCADDFYRRAE